MGLRRAEEKLADVESSKRTLGPQEGFKYWDEKMNIKRAMKELYS